MHNRFIQNYRQWQSKIVTNAESVRLPLKYIDPNGMEWYKHQDGSYQFDPNINANSKLAQGQVYMGATFSDSQGKYQKDGSIIFADETDAYNRMWTQANDHYKKQKEVGGFILKNGNVWVTPDYNNDLNECTPAQYGYTVNKKGELIKNDKNYEILGFIHTHQNPKADPTPSAWTGSGYGDLGYSRAMGNLPVITIGHDGLIHGIFDNVPVGVPVKSTFDYDSRKNLLNGQNSLVKWLINYPTRKK